jgi:hypothetical protein
VSEMKEGDDATAGNLTGARTHRWVDALPSSGSSMGPYPHARSHESRSDSSSTTHGDHGGLEHRLSSRFPSAQQRATAQDQPARRVD